MERLSHDIRCALILRHTYVGRVTCVPRVTIVGNCVKIHFWSTYMYESLCHVRPWIYRYRMSYYQECIRPPPTCSYALLILYSVPTLSVSKRLIEIRTRLHHLFMFYCHTIYGGLARRPTPYGGLARRPTPYDALYMYVYDAQEVLSQKFS